MGRMLKQGMILTLVAALMGLMPARADNGPVAVPWVRLTVDLRPGYGPKADAYNADRSAYDDGSISVTLHTQVVHGTLCTYAHVKIKDPSQLRTAAAGSFTTQGTLAAASIARRYQAVVALNGDYFAFDTTGYVLRQGKQYRNRPTGEDVLIIDDLGDFHSLKGPQTAGEIDAYVQALTDQGRQVINGFTFGPHLVLDGEVVPVGKNYFSISPQRRTQRMAIAQLGELEYMIASTEGPEDKDSAGLTIPDFASFIMDAALTLNPEGCRAAFNLDGGSSNTLYFDGKKVNSPGGKTRSISDILYFASLVP